MRPPALPPQQKRIVLSLQRFNAMAQRLNFMPQATRHLIGLFFDALILGSKLRLLLLRVMRLALEHLAYNSLEVLRRAARLVALSGRRRELCLHFSELERGGPRRGGRRGVGCCEGPPRKACLR